MELEFVIAVGAASSSAALLAALVVEPLVSTRTATAVLPTPRVWWLRAVWPFATRCGPALVPLLPAAYADGTSRRLRAAEIDRSLTAGTWSAAVLVYGAVAATLAAALAVMAGLAVVPAMLVGAVIGGTWPELRLRRAIGERYGRIRRELPLYLDVLTLAVESGSSLTGAIALAAEKSPDGPLRRAFLRFLGEVRAGRPRAEALRSLDEYVAVGSVSTLIAALLQSEKTGARLGKVLRAQAAQRTQERFARAEKLAMQAPVRMLGPLILCIFPCTFLVLGFPIYTKLTAGF
jgi:tight adherence protein C